MKQQETCTWKGRPIKIDFYSHTTSTGAMEFGAEARLEMDGFTWGGSSHDESINYYHPVREDAKAFAISNLEKAINTHASGKMLEECERSIKQVLANKETFTKQQEYSKSLQKMLKLGV